MKTDFHDVEADWPNDTVNPIKAIYKCGTKADIEPNVTALKVFYDSSTKNFTEIGIQNHIRFLIKLEALSKMEISIWKPIKLSLIDRQLFEQGVRYPVYEWVYNEALFEEFLSGYVDYGDSDFSNEQERLAVTRKIDRDDSWFMSHEIRRVNRNKAPFSPRDL